MTTNPIPGPRSVPLVPAETTSDEELPFRTIDCPEEARQLLKQGLVRAVIADVMVARDTPDSQQIRARAAGLLIPEAVRVGPEPRTNSGTGSGTRPGVGTRPGTRAQSVAGLGVGPGAGWVVGFGSAAWLHTGFTATAPDPPTELQVIVPPGRHRPRRAGVQGRQVALGPEHVVYLGPVPVTDPVRTAADIARDLPATAALAALHRLGELCGVHPNDVLQVLATMRYARGAATARHLVKTWMEDG